MLSKNRRKRASFILVEALISSLLFVMLLAVMFGIFWRCSKMSALLANQQKKIEELLVAQTRLQTIFSNTVFQINQKPYFYIDNTRGAGNQSLVFTFYNDPLLKQHFAGRDGARLYVEDGGLYLAYWQHNEKMSETPTMMRKELLLHNIASMQIELFAAPAKTSPREKKPAQETQKPLEAQWNTEYPIDFNKRPALIKLKCLPQNSETPLLFWFVLPREILIIPYKMS